MIINKFKYAAIDSSWILSRNAFSIAGRNETYTEADIVKMTIQSLNKWLRDLGLSCDRMIFFKDTWDSSCKGYYRTKILRDAGAAVEYKGDRKYVTAEILEEIKADPASTEEDIKKAEKELYFNTVKNKAKNILTYELQNLGISTISVPGWEFDDLATLMSHILVEDDKPSVIVTKDSDLIYSTSPNCYLWMPPLGGRPEKLMDYATAYNEYLPDRFKGKLSLYQYKAMADSTGAVGHNNVSRTLKEGRNVDDAIERSLAGDWSDFDNPEIFKAQYGSFDIWSFPRYQEAESIIRNLDKVPGHLGNLDEFHGFCNKHGITGISDKYFTDFQSHFDYKLFSNGTN